jgi:uncharacterized protein (TIGR03546 family)
MTLLLKQFYNFLRLLNSDTGTVQIAMGVAAGFVLGMTPFFSLQSVLIFVALFLFRIQIGAAFTSAFFFSFVAYLLDPLFHSVGTQILETQALQGLFTDLYNMPVVPYSRFNNTIVMGSGVVAFVLSPLIFLSAFFGVRQYRVLVVDKIRKSKLWMSLQGTTVYQWYSKYEDLYGAN